MDKPEPHPDDMCHCGRLRKEHPIGGHWACPTFRLAWVAIQGQRQLRVPEDEMPVDGGV